MNLSIVRPFSSFLVAVALIVVIEFVFSLTGYQTRYSSNFMEHSPFKQEAAGGSKWNIYGKLEDSPLGRLPADIIQVGDSSGLFGVQPLAVQKELPDGMTYSNMSCCGDLGWAGHLAEAQAAVLRNPAAKVLVLHVTPYWLPGTRKFNERNPLAESLQTNVASVFRYANLPTMNVRLGFKRWIETGKYDPSYGIAFKFRPPWNYDSILESRGWLPIQWTVNLDNMKKVALRTCDYSDGIYEPMLLGLSQRKVIYTWLKNFRDFAADHKMQLAIVFGPVPCQRREGRFLTEIEADIAKFQNDYPEVFIPYTVTHTVGPELMVDQWHLSAEASLGYSTEFGRRLKAWLKGEPTDHPYLDKHAVKWPPSVAGKVVAWTEAVAWPYMRMTPEPTRCFIVFPEERCKNRPGFSHRWEDIDLNAGVSQERCMQRAAEFVNACQSTQPITSVFVQGSTTLASQTAEPKL